MHIDIPFSFEHPQAGGSDAESNESRKLWFNARDPTDFEELYHFYTGQRDYCIRIQNVVDMNIRAANHAEPLRGEAFNVACGDRTTNNEILAALKARFGDLDIDHAPPRPGDVMHTQADISETERVFGYKPLVRFWPGFEKTLSWWDI